MRAVINAPVFMGALGRITKELDEWIEKLNIT